MCSIVPIYSNSYPDGASSWPPVGCPYNGHLVLQMERKIDCILAAVAKNEKEAVVVGSPDNRLIDRSQKHRELLLQVFHSPHSGD